MDIFLRLAALTRSATTVNNRLVDGAVVQYRRHSTF